MIDLNQYSGGLQHIGIPTDDIERTIAFYTSLGFSVALRTENKSASEQVAFLRLGNLTIETYENKRAVLRSGAIDHIALDVTNIDSLFEALKSAGFRILDAHVQSLPFWERGVRFFSIAGPNEEKIEFCERL